MRKIFIFGLVAFFSLLVLVNATTDEQLSEFFNMYASNFQIQTVWAGQAVTPSGQVAKLSIVNIKWTDNHGQVFQQRRFYANFQGSASDVVRHFSDGQDVTTLMTYPQGTCEQEAPDGSCGVKSFWFMYSYNTIGDKRYYHKYIIDVDPATGQATAGVVKEIIVDATFTGKADIEDTPPNIQNNPLTLTFVNQNGILSKDTTSFVTQVPPS